MGVTANKLLIDLRDFAALVREREDYVSSEIETRTSLINPFLETLGWDVRNPKICRQEFRSDLSGHRMVDYALFDKEGNLVIIVEAKPKNVKLEDNKIFDQLNGYFAHSTASFGIITNGCIYRWYTRDGDTGFLKTTPSLVFDVREPNSHDAEFLQAFVGTSFERDAAKKIAIEVELQSRLMSWFKNVSNEPSEKFTRWLIREARENYPTLTLPNTLSQSRIAKYQQIVKSALNKFVYERHLALANHDKLESDKETGPESEEGTVSSTSSASSVQETNVETCEVENGEILQSTRLARAYRFRTPHFIKCANGKSALIKLLSCFADAYIEGSESFAAQLVAKCAMVSDTQQNRHFSKCQIGGQTLWIQGLNRRGIREVVRSAAKLFNPPLIEGRDYDLWMPSLPPKSAQNRTNY
ncbi:MAG: hypothetical protein F4W92_04940 [Gammaproteobacteria bacterium]|nr:hypothetical protein [Gammaproteobacteria bacterium]